MSSVRTLSTAIARTILVAAVGIILGGGAGTGRPVAAQEQDSTEASPPEYRLLRQEEDWSDVGERSHSDALAALKCLPFLQMPRTFLTVGGQARAYAHRYRNEQWGRIAGPDAYLLQRLMLHGSAEPTGLPHGMQARIFMQLKSGLVAARDGPVYPPDKDLIGINQAFLGLGLSLRPARELTTRVGRQELHYGAGRMIAVREGPNVRLGYDALLGRYESGPWRTDAFVAKPNETRPGVLDNGWMPGRTLWGVHLRRQPTAGTGWALYYVGTSRNPAPLNANARAIRHTIGGRRHGTVGRLNYDLEAAVQVGHYRRSRNAAEQHVREDHSSSPGSADVPIRAWMGAGHLTYRAPNTPGRPALGLHFHLSSGDLGKTAAHETFAAPYPSGRFTGAGSRLGPGNLLNVRPVLGFRLASDLHVRLTTHVFARLHATDGIYAVWGAPLRAASDSASRFIGWMPEGILTWEAGRHLTLALEASYFKTGALLQEHAPGRDMTHLGLRATYVF